MSRLYRLTLAACPDVCCDAVVGNGRPIKGPVIEVAFAEAKVAVTGIAVPVHVDRVRAEIVQKPVQVFLLIPSPGRISCTNVNV